MVRPVVENELDHIDVCLNRLGLEEIVGHECDARFHIFRHVGVERGLNFGEILNYDVEIGVVSGENYIVMTSRAAKLEHVSH